MLHKTDAFFTKTAFQSTDPFLIDSTQKVVYSSEPQKHDCILDKENIYEHYCLEVGDHI